MEGRRIDRPEPGYYATRLRKGCHPIPVIIWLDAHRLDPVTGEPLDRSPILRARMGDAELPVTIGGRTYELLEMWPGLWVISEEQYEALLARIRWALENDPDNPAVNPLAPLPGTYWATGRVIDAIAANPTAADPKKREGIPRPRLTPKEQRP